MKRIVFLADNTIPGLGCSDLYRRAIDAVALGHGEAEDSRARRMLRGFDARMLSDIGLDRRAA